MPGLTFIGTATQNLFNSQNVPAIPPNTLPNPTNGQFFEFNFGSSTINWGNNPPPSNIRNLTPFQLVNSLGTLFRTITFSPSTIIRTGQQIYTDASQPTTYIQFNVEGDNQISTIQPAAPGEGGIDTFATYSNNVSPFTNVPPENIGGVFEIYVNVYNQCFSTLPGCVQYAATGFTMDAILTITLTILCEGIGLENTVCSKYCEVRENLQVCYPDFVNYCLQPGANGQLVIGSSTTCQEFFKDYIADVGVDATLDTALNTYCSKYSGFDTLLDVNGQRNTQSEIDLCACNLNQTIYDNLRESLIRAFPAYAGVPEDERCLFPECVDSPFKNTSTTQVCVVPNCINIASINNNGTVVGGITIRQSTGACANIVGGGGATGATGATGSNGTGEKSFWEKYWLWIILGGGLLIVLIIVILIIIAAESGKKPKIEKV